ncbi:MAG TPA: helix-turn-helix transcriptional regulator [Fimbriimonadaceae bacterium]|nr:helix-turn-helix transcriptional regulator [Fimbriimonadaceae bacterium]
MQRCAAATAFAFGLCSVLTVCMHQPLTPQAFGPAINRLSDVMEHSDRLSFCGVRRLARAARVSPSSVSRLMHGQINPSFLLVARITTAVEKATGLTIDPRDIVAEHGEFLTRFTCDLMQCRGCLPEAARDSDGHHNPKFAGVAPGKWVCSRNPEGISERKSA